MPFEKGQSGNPEGRPKGSSNKIKSKLRESITGFLEDNFSDIQKEFRHLEPRDKLKFYIDLLQYGLPKLSAISTEIDIEKLSDEQLNELYQKVMDSINNQS